MKSFTDSHFNRPAKIWRMHLRARDPDYWLFSIRRSMELVTIGCDIVKQDRTEMVSRLQLSVSSIPFVIKCLYDIYSEERKNAT